MLFSIWPKRPFFDRLYHDRRCPTSGFGNRMTFSNNPEKLSLFGGGCNENDRILDLYGGLYMESHWVGLVTRSPSLFLWRKRSVVMAPLHLQSQKMPHKTKWLLKVGPQVLPARIFHKRSPLFQQEGLHCTLEAHESCTFCAGRLIAGKVIKTLQTWRYVWSFTNLWRLNVIKWAGEITNLYKKFKPK